MANFGLYERPYIKIATTNDICYCCHKDICMKERRDAFDVAHELRGKLENQLVFYIRKSGQDTCICFDCLKELANELTANDKDEVSVAVEAPVEVATEAKQEVKEETKKSTNKKTNK